MTQAGQKEKRWRRRAVRLAEQVNMKTFGADDLPEFVRDPDFIWDGQYLYVDRPATNVIHDVAHFLVASPRRRKVPEFGLGPAPDWTKRRDEARKMVRLCRKSAAAEEEMASVLGILIEKSWGMPWTFTAIEHDWTLLSSGGLKSFGQFREIAKSQLSCLAKRNLIDNQYNPVIRRRL